MVRVSRMGVLETMWRSERLDEKKNSLPSETNLCEEIVSTFHLFPGEFRAAKHLCAQKRKKRPQVAARRLGSSAAGSWGRMSRFFLFYEYSLFWCQLGILRNIYRLMGAKRSPGEFFLAFCPPTMTVFPPYSPSFLHIHIHQNHAQNCPRPRHHCQTT